MSLSPISRTREIRGYEFPGIIHNGGHYFLVGLKVYADGLVDCWDMVDLPMFKQKLAKGWVVTDIPDGECLSIHGLAAITVTRATWTHNTKSFIKHIRQLTEQLNPRMENLYNCHGRSTEKINGVNFAAVSSGRPQPTKTEQPITPISRSIYGQALMHFKVTPDGLSLVNVQLFGDGTAVITGCGEPQTLPFESFAEQLTDPACYRQPEPGDLVTIEGLVQFTVGEVQHATDPGQLAAEFNDTYAQVNGQPGAIRTCVDAFEQYIAKPDQATRDALRKAYESVPEHLKRFCGDMDTKDIPIRMVLYGEGEIENWSHYQLSQALGYELPKINVPKPQDDEPPK